MSRTRSYDDELDFVPITLSYAKWFVGQYHRHTKPPQGWKFGVGITYRGIMVGVGTAGRPVARHLDDGVSLEISRTCVLSDVEELQINSRIYGTLMRAGKALGYKVCYTYTLVSESGSSLKAVGFKEDGKVEGRLWTGLLIRTDTVGLRDYDVNTEDKIRWKKSL